MGASKHKLTGVTVIHKGKLLHELSSYPLWCVLRPNGSRPSRHYFFQRPCANCGQRSFSSIQSLGERSFCSNDCFARFFRGSNHPGWKGFSHSAGHKVIRVVREGCSRSQYVSEHRLIAENTIGRELSSHELVHHIDCDKHNNAPDNLDVLTQAEHASAHQSVNGILRGLIQSGIVWFDREKKIYRSKYGEIDIHSEAINRYHRNLRISRRLSGNPIGKRRKNPSMALSAIIERERTRKVA
jgi:hypothetical protein